MANNLNEIWIISVPGEKTPQESWDRLQAATSSLSVSNKFNVPDLKVNLIISLINFFLLFNKV